jgi:hypothetical protein
MSYGGFPEKVDEQRILSQIQTETTNRQQYANQATPDLAKRIGDIYRANPWMKPGEILALAKANASDQLVNAASTQSGKQLNVRLEPNKPQSKNWVERNVYDPLKSAARYTFATLNLAPELAQNVASQALNPDNPEGFDGFFKSTSLGTMIAASKGEIDPNTGQPITAGEGFFLGGTALEKQAERARRVRGTINGNAWTLGRGAADVVSAPGTKPYSILSGFIDGAVNVFADPTLVAGKALKGVRTAGATIPGLKTAEEISAFAKVARQGELAAAGLSDAETIAWNGSKFREYFETNGKAQRLIDTVVERDDAYDIFSNVFKGKIDVATANRLAQTTNRDEILAIVGEQTNRMDAQLSGLFPEDIRELMGARERLPGYNTWRNSKLLTKIPDHVIRSGSAEDSIKAVNSYGNYLKTIGLDLTQGEGKDFMKEVMRVFADPTAAGSGAINTLFETTVKRVVVDDLTKGVLGLEKEAADEIAKTLFERVAVLRDDIKTYLINESGSPDDFGLIGALNDSGNLVVGDDINPNNIRNLVLAGPGSLVELADKIQVLPDIRSVRRLTSNPFVRRNVARRAGEPGAVTALSDYLQNEIWKPLTLMTGGYVMRNMFDAQIRMAAVGRDGFFNHPFRYIMTVLNKTLPEGFMRGGVGQMDEGFIDTAQNFDEYASKFQEALEFGIRRNLDDPKKLYERGIRNGAFITVNKIGNKEQYLEGVYDELRRLSQDQINNAVAKGIPQDEMVAWFRNNNDPKAVAALDKLRRYLEGGLDTVDVTTGRHHIVRIAQGGVNDDVLAAWVNRLGNPRIQALTGGDDTLRFAIAHRRMPLTASETINPNNLVDADFFDGSLRQGVGSIVRMGMDGDEPILAVVTSVNGPNSWTARRLSNFDVWDSAEGKKELQGYITGLYNSPVNTLPDWVKFAQTVGVPKTKEISEKALQANKALNRAVDGFFGFYGRKSAKYERSPVFRQFFYEQFNKNADLLSRDEARDLLRSIPGRAERLEMNPEQLFGGKKQYDELVAKLNSANGTGTVKQLEDYSQIRALQSTKETLFNAAERNNLEDIMRIIIPFGAAWREILSSYAKFAVEDPRTIRRAQLIYNGATNFDPDNDGQGFFYKDPITGANTFNLPFSGEFTKLLTGVNAPLQANVKGLSMGLQVIPAVGPVVQMAASEIIPDTPSTDSIISVLLPYGRKEPSALVPGWASKMYSALRDNEGKLQSIYANTYGETVRAMSASGEYELNDPAEKERLLQDSKWRARVLTGLRALSQFAGPTVGNPEAIIKTDQGDVYASFLVKEFQVLQQENYDTAVKEFLNRHGDDALLYISSKTQSVQPGVQASDQFGDWERKNKDVMSAYKNVAAYFATGGDDFSFSVWERQIRLGQRKRLSADEMIDLAQYKVGNSIYRDLKKQGGKYPNAEVKSWLSRQRQKIHEQYPGFPAKAIFTLGEFERNVEEMGRAVNDTRLADNPIAQAVREYLEYRTKAVDSYVKSGGKPGGFATAKSAADLRQWLFNIGTALSEVEPDFQRVWDRELSSEVDEL